MKFTLQRKIIAAILLLVLPLGIYGWRHYREMIEHDTWHIRLLNREVAADGARMLDEYVERSFALLRPLALHPAVYDRDGSAGSRLFAELLKQEPILLNIIAVDKEGRMFGSAINPSAAKMMNHRESPWFREALKGPFVGGYHISRLSQVPTVMVALPIRGRAGDVVGAIAAPLGLDSLGRLLKEKLWLPEGAELHVQDGVGNLVIDTEGSAVTAHRIPAGASLDDGEVSDGPDGNQYLYSSAAAPAIGWKVVVAIPLEAAYKDARDFGKRFLVAFFAVALAALAAGLLMARRIGKRVKEVVGGMKEMEQGNLAARIAPKGDDELRVISEQFNAMADARDRSERALREAVARVTEEQARTKAVLESIGDAISIQDRDFRILYQNAAQKQFFGDRTGEFCFHAYEGNERICDGCGISRCFRDGKSHTVVRSAEIEGRGTVYAEITSSPLRDQSGAIVAGIEVARDVTERKRIEEELRLKDFAIRSAVTAIAFVGLDENIQYVNEAFLRMFGVERPGDVVGKPAAFFGENEGTFAQLRQALLDGGNWIGERRARRNDGALLEVFISAHVIRDAAGTPAAVMASLLDITEKKEKDTRLILSERLVALGKMASGIAHEINNPLAAIAGCAEGLRTRIDKGRIDPDFFQSYLAIIQEEVFRCKNITSSMLSMVRESSYEKKIFDINETVRKAVDVIGYQGRLRNVTVEMDLQPGKLEVLGSEGEIRQVMIAIVSNSLDAMEEFGTIRIGSGRENGSVFLSIADEGPGIPAELRSRIFDPFFTTKMCTGGTGLGLSIAARIINNHGGSISVDSDEGYGAMFKLKLPAYQATGAERKELAGHDAKVQQ